jgi:Protein of unknown function (DUF1091)
MDLQHRSITPYFNSVINATINLCEALSSPDSNLVLKFVMSIFKKSLPPGFFHPCPYTGEFKSKNMSFENVPELSSFLGGTYRSINRFYDHKDGNIFTAFLEFEM